MHNVDGGLGVSELHGGGEGVEDGVRPVVEHRARVEVVVGQDNVGYLDGVTGVDVDAVGVVAFHGATVLKPEGNVTDRHLVTRIETAAGVAGARVDES